MRLFLNHYFWNYICKSQSTIRKSPLLNTDSLINKNNCDNNENSNNDNKDRKYNLYKYSISGNRPTCQEAIKISWDFRVVLKRNTFDVNPHLRYLLNNKQSAYVKNKYSLGYTQSFWWYFSAVDFYTLYNQYDANAEETEPLQFSFS